MSLPQVADFYEHHRETYRDRRRSIGEKPDEGARASI